MSDRNDVPGQLADLGLPSVSETCLDLQLDQFCVYRSPNHPEGFQSQYEYLHVAATHLGVGCWMVNGLLRPSQPTQEQHRPQHRVSGTIQEIHIGHYQDPSKHTTSGAIWVRIEENGSHMENTGTWYRLGQPSRLYYPFWHKFLWLADLTKYFIDYLHASSGCGRKVTLLHFQSKFAIQLCEWHGDHETHGARYQQWFQQRQDVSQQPVDFRHDILWYHRWLWHQAISVSGTEQCGLLNHPVWEQINVHPQNLRQVAANRPKDEKTVVTTNVAICFYQRFPQWQDDLDLLRVVDICLPVQHFQKQRRQKWSFPNKLDHQQEQHFRVIHSTRKGSSRISLVDILLEEASIINCPVNLATTGQLLGQVVIIRKPDNKYGGYSFHYAWVRQQVSQTKVAVIWLLRPSDTLCGSAFYPIGNELFFSTECNCHPILTIDIIQVIPVSTFSDHALPGTMLFIHSTFDLRQQAHLNASISTLVNYCKDNFHNLVKKVPVLSRPKMLPKIKMLGLFSGMGLLEYSMASTGYIQPVCAIEQWTTAATTYKANGRPGRTNIVTASVNPTLQSLTTGKYHIEPVECIAAGCPCQGYSLLNSNRESYKSQQNCSLLANTLSWYEVLLPAYGVIENVPHIDHLDPNPCEQAICHLVALGYQVRKTVVDVSTLGGASSRKRLIIMVTAPGAVLPEVPVPNYGGDSDQEVFTCQEAIGDLAPITNDTTLNISDPCHVPVYRFGLHPTKNIDFQHLIQRIPIEPAGLGVVAAYSTGCLTTSQEEWFQTLSECQQGKSSKCLKRLNPNKPFKTICCSISPFDGKHGGEILHFAQHRTVSLKEIRRAMDVPDSFLIAGSLRDQYKQLGNAVPWTLGAALGRVVGKAWVATLTASPGLADPSTTVRFAPITK